MSLFDSASLVVTPNGVKEGKLYSIKPTDGSGDLSVTRATTATRVNSAGLVEVVPYNILTYSNTFTNTNWVKNACTITANSIISPDGTQNASKLVESSANDSHHIYQNAVASGLNTFSFYAKAGERNFVYAYADSVGQGKCFDLQNGTIGANIIAAPTNATITSIGNGWYRCTITLNIASSSALRIGACSANGTFSYLGNGTSGIYIYGAQLDSGTLAKEYLRTETRLNIPRLDYTNGSCPSILVEPQRTNLVLRSEEFDNVIWTKNNTTISANSTISPSGTLTADKLVENNTNNIHSIFQQISYSIGVGYNFSFYAKKSEKNILQIFFEFQITTAYCNFDLQNGTLNNQGFTNAFIQNVGNDWYRCSVSFTSSNSQLRNSVIAIVPNINSLRAQSYLGDGTSGIFIWGSQIEAGANATSYIPTTSASVTRNADLISKTGISSLIGQTEGTLFVDINWQQKSGVFFINSISDGSTNNEIYLSFGNSFDNAIRFSIASGGSISVSSDSSVLTSGRYKIAFAYANNNVVGYINGTQIFTDSTATIPATSEFKFLRANNTLGFSGSINSSVIFKERLTDDQLAQLTTL
jgi:hypothetical protein